MVEMELPRVSFDQQSWNRYLLLGLLSALILLNAISNREFQRVFFSLRHDFKLPSVSTLSRLLESEYDKTIEAIKHQILLGQRVSIALDGWTAQSRLAITSVIIQSVDKIFRHLAHFGQGATPKHTN